MQEAIVFRIDINNKEQNIVSKLRLYKEYLRTWLLLSGALKYGYDSSVIRGRSVFFSKDVTKAVTVCVTAQTVFIAHTSAFFAYLHSFDMLHSKQYRYTLALVRS